MTEAISSRFKGKLAAIPRATFLALVVVLALSWLNISIAAHIRNVQSYFHDMHGDDALPAMTAFVFDFQLLLNLLSALIPALGIVVLFSKRPFLYLFVLILLALIEIAALYFCLIAPAITHGFFQHTRIHR